VLEAVGRPAGLGPGEEELAVLRPLCLLSSSRSSTHHVERRDDLVRRQCRHRKPLRHWRPRRAARKTVPHSQRRWKAEPDRGFGAEEAGRNYLEEARYVSEGGACVADSGAKPTACWAFAPPYFTTGEEGNPRLGRSPRPMTAPRRPGVIPHRFRAGLHPRPDDRLPAAALEAAPWARPAPKAGCAQ